MSTLELKDELLDAQSSGITGKLQVLGKLDGARMGATIDLYEGKVIKLRVGMESGQAAAKLLTTMSIGRVVFMKTSSINSSPEVDTPDIDALIEMTGDPQSDPSDPSKDATDDEITEKTIKALSQVMGPSSEDIIKDIAAKFPPDKDEKLFLNKCREVAAGMVGASMANNIFDSLLNNPS